MTAEYQPRRPPSRTTEGARLARHSHKDCVVCHNTFPNTLEHFGQGVTGRITRTCLACTAVRQPVADHTEDCPVCGRPASLAADKGGPKVEGRPLRVCRRCLTVVRMTVDVAGDGLERLGQWLVWRARK